MWAGFYLLPLGRVLHLRKWSLLCLFSFYDRYSAAGQRRPWFVGSRKSEISECSSLLRWTRRTTLGWRLRSWEFYFLDGTHLRKLALGSWSSAIAGTTRPSRKHIARSMLVSDVMIQEICITLKISIRIKTLPPLQQRRENEQVQGWGSAFLRTTANFSRCVPGLRITARHHH